MEIKEMRHADIEERLSAIQTELADENAERPAQTLQNGRQKRNGDSDYDKYAEPRLK